VELSREALPAIVQGARDAWDAVAATLDTLDDDDMRAPSLLPGWSRAHVVTHLARNAESHVRLLEAGRSGRLVEQYAGGRAARAAAIEDGASRPAAALVADAQSANARLFELWSDMQDEEWRLPVGARGGESAWELVWSRWKEIAVHHVDLATAFGPADWDSGFVDTLLSQVLKGLSDRLADDTTVEMTTGAWRARAGNGGEVIVIEGTRAEILAWAIGRPEAAPMLVARAGDGAATLLPVLAAWR
jgi:maleylpyruvate isomerase